MTKSHHLTSTRKVSTTSEDMLKLKKPKKTKSLRKKDKLNIDALEAEARSAGGDHGPKKGELWKRVLPVAKSRWTEEYKWSFTNLENALEEGGPLNAGNVYLFSFAEQRLVLWNGQESYTCIPIIIAVSSSCPPSQKIGILYPICSTGIEEIVDMRSRNLEWVPCTLPRAASKANPRIFILSRLGGGSENNNRVEESGTCVPYFDNCTLDICPEEASEEQRIRFYKFYPDATNYTPSVPVKTKFINRYYWEAHEVV